MRLMRRQYLLKKFENAIKKSFYQFRRMKIDIGTFLRITKNDEPINDSEGLYFFKAIKDGDLENIENMVKKIILMQYFEMNLVKQLFIFVPKEIYIK